LLAVNVIETINLIDLQAFAELMALGRFFDQ
jgi:hypothetical protein